MQWVEVIQLRSIVGNRERLESKLQMLIDEVDRANNKQVIMAFSRVLIETDFSIHILHDSEEVDHSGSMLGLRLVNALKEFGLVNHGIWENLKGK